VIEEVEEIPGDFRLRIEHAHPLVRCEGALEKVELGVAGNQDQRTIRLTGCFFPQSRHSQPKHRGVITKTAALQTPPVFLPDLV